METRSNDAARLERSVLAWLAAEAALGSRQAMQELLRRLQRPVLTFLARMLDSPADAQDVWQDTALAVWRDVGKLRDSTMARAWVFRIARFKAVDVLRGRVRRSETEMPDSLASDEQSPERLLDADGLLDRLQEDDRTLLSLFYLYGFTLEEIAETLGVRPGTARVRLFRARGKIKAMLEGETP